MNLLSEQLSRRRLLLWPARKKAPGQKVPAEDPNPVACHSLFIPSKLPTVTSMVPFVPKISVSTIYRGDFLSKTDLRKRKGKRNIDLLFHLFMHSSVDSCTCPEWGSNLQPWHTRMTL